MKVQGKKNVLFAPFNTVYHLEDPLLIPDYLAALCYSQTKVISVFYSVFQLTFNSKQQTSPEFAEYAVFTSSQLFQVARHEILGRQVPQ